MSSRAQGKEGWGCGRRKGSRADLATNPHCLWKAHKVLISCSRDASQRTENHPWTWPSFVSWSYLSMPRSPLYSHFLFTDTQLAPGFTLCSTCETYWPFSPHVFLPSGYVFLLGFFTDRTWCLCLLKRFLELAVQIPPLSPPPVHRCDSNNTAGRPESPFHSAYYPPFSVLSLVAFAWAIMGDPHVQAF